MKLRGIFRLAQNRTFNYIPRYYDPKKEQEEKRKKELLELVEIEKQKVIARNNPQNVVDANESAYQKNIISALNIQKREENTAKTNQSIIVMILIISCLGFWYLGTEAILFTIPSIIWVAFRMKMKRGRKYNIDDIEKETGF